MNPLTRLSGKSPSSDVNTKEYATLIHQFYITNFKKKKHETAAANSNTDITASNYNFACCFVLVWNLVADIEGGKEAEGVWEYGVEENIWT